MALKDLTGQQIQNTYQKVVQTDGTNLADGTGSLLPISFNGNNVIVSGSLIAQTYVVSESVINVSSGSTIFGNSEDDSHFFSGSITSSGNISSSGNITANRFYGDASDKYIAVDASGTNLGTNGGWKVGSHITASGNISSSGNLTLSQSLDFGAISSNIGFGQSGNTNSALTIRRDNQDDYIEFKNESTRIYSEGGVAFEITDGASGGGDGTIHLGYGGISDIWLGSGGTLLQHTDITNARTDFAHRVRIAPKTNIPNDNAMLNKSTLYVSGSTYLDGPISSSVIIDAPGVDDDGSGGGMIIGSTFQVGAALEVKGNIVAESIFVDENSLFIGGTSFSKNELDTLKEGKTLPAPAKDITGTGNVASADGITNYIRPEVIYHPTDDESAIIHKAAGRLQYRSPGGDPFEIYADGSSNDYIRLGSTTTNKTSIIIPSHITASGNISSSGTITANSFVGNVTGEASTAVDASRVTNNLSVDNVTIKLNSGVVYNGSSARTLSIKDGGVDSDALADNITVTELTTTNITASGNISSSGYINALNYVDVKASGTGYKLSGAKIVYNENSAYNFGRGPSATRITGSTIELSGGHVTASGNISSSGYITSKYIRMSGPESSGTHRFIVAPPFQETDADSILLGGNVRIAQKQAQTAAGITPPAAGEFGNLSVFGHVSASELQSNTWVIPNANGKTYLSYNTSTDYLELGGAAQVGAYPTKGIKFYTSGSIANGFGSIFFGGDTGYIEADGYISGSEFRTTGHITASGNISASGDLTANNITGVTSIESTLYTIDGINAIDYASDTHLFGSTAKFSKLRTQQGLEITAPVTASSHISASGNIYSKNEEIFQSTFLTDSDSVNWHGPNRQGPTYYFWNYDYGTDAQVGTIDWSSAGHNERTLNSGWRVPYKMEITRFHVYGHNSQNASGTDETLTFTASIFMGNPETEAKGQSSMTLHPLGTFISTTGESRYGAMSGSADISSALRFVSESQWIYPRIKCNNDDQDVNGTWTVYYRRIK